MVSQDLKDSPYFRCASRQDTSPGHVRWSCCKGLFLGPTGWKYHHRCSIFGGRLLLSLYDFVEVGIRTTRIEYRAALGEVNDLFQNVWKTTELTRWGITATFSYKPPGSRDAQSKRWKAAQQLRWTLWIEDIQPKGWSLRYLPIRVQFAVSLLKICCTLSTIGIGSMKVGPIAKAKLLCRCTLPRAGSLLHSSLCLANRWIGSVEDWACQAGRWNLFAYNSVQCRSKNQMSISILSIKTLEVQRCNCEEL